MLSRYESPAVAVSNWLEEMFGSNVLEAADRMLKSGNWPNVDIREDEKSFRVVADIPGLSKEDIKITVEDSTLRIEGEKKSDAKAEKGYYCRLERSYGKFCRSFLLPESIDLDKIQASVDKGVLELIIPKAEKALPRTIEIQ